MSKHFDDEESITSQETPSSKRMGNPRMKRPSMFRDKEDRNQFAALMTSEPGLLEQFRILCRMEAYDLHPDYMFSLNKETGKYDRTDDPYAWNGRIKEPGKYDRFAYMSICLIKHRDGSWLIHG